jgi:hypothetical protein
LSVFACPACSIVFQALPKTDEFLCPNGSCGQHMRRPPSGTTMVAYGHTTPTVIATPPSRLTERIRLLQIRVWAAAVRDREAEHASIPSEATRLAKMVCELLDAREATTAANARTAIDSSLAVLIGLLVLSGVSWIAGPASPR